jgi:hypothetical protein
VDRRQLAGEIYRRTHRDAISHGVGGGRNGGSTR